jgi:hypothetical protein
VDAGHGRRHLGEKKNKKKWTTRTISAGEERLAGEHLGEDAADGPDVDRARVLLERKHHLRRAVPPAHGSALGGPRPKDGEREREGGGDDRTSSRRIRSGTSSCRSPRSAAASPSAPGQSRRAIYRRRRSRRSARAVRSGIGKETQPR